MATPDTKPAAPNNLLQFQNQQLSLQLEVKKEEVSALEEKVKEFQKKEGDYAETLLCVNRLWNQVQSDIQLLSARVGEASTSGAPATEPDEAKPLIKQGASKDAAGVKKEIASAAVPDPFLERLLASGSAAAKEAAQIQAEVAESASDLERTLATRCHDTKEALAKLLDAIDAQRKARYEAALASASSQGDDAKQQMEALVREAAEARAQADAAVALQRSLEEQMEQLDKQHLEDQANMNKLQIEMADLLDRFNNAQRKLVTMRSNDQVSPRASGGLSGARGSGSGLRLPTEGSADMDILQSLLDKRTAEVEQGQEAITKLMKELREVKDAMRDESHVPQTRMYQLAQRQIACLVADVEKQRVQLESMQRDRDEMLHHQQHLQLQIEAATHNRVVMQQYDVRVREVEASLKAAVSAADEAEIKLQRERERMGQAKTAGELKLMVATLQKEIGVLQSSLEKHKGLSKQIDAFRKEAQDARDFVRANELELQRLRDKVQQQEGEMQQLRSLEDKLKLEVEDLHLFVQLLQDVSEDAADVTELRRREARLREELQAATAQLEGSPLQETITELKKAVAAKEAPLQELQRQLDGMRVAAARSEDTIKDLRAQVVSAKAETGAYAAEMVTIGGAYEDMQAQNTRLLQLLTERDEANNQMVNESIRAGQAAAQLAKEQEAAVSAAARAEASANHLRTRVSELESKLQASVDEVTTLRERGHGYAAQADNTARRLAEAEDASRQKDVLLESAQRLAAERKKLADDEAERASRERTKRQLQDDEIKALSGRMEKMRKVEEAGGAGKLMANEVNTLRTLLNCNVCHERQKDVIITKCWHMFCEPCIKRNLDSRNRKCPGCSQLFGAADVKHFFFT